MRINCFEHVGLIVKVTTSNHQTNQDPLHIINHNAVKRWEECNPYKLFVASPLHLAKRMPLAIEPRLRPGLPHCWHASCSASLPEDQRADHGASDELPTHLEVPRLGRDVIELRHEPRQEEVATDDDEDGEDGALHDGLSFFPFQFSSGNTTRLLTVT